jgi:hypothetical protein
MSLRSTNVAMYEAPTVPCKRCGVPRTCRPGHIPDWCASCRDTSRTKVDVSDLELVGGMWRLDPVARVQRWVAA